MGFDGILQGVHALIPLGGQVLQRAVRKMASPAKNQDRRWWLTHVFRNVQHHAWWLPQMLRVGVVAKNWSRLARRFQLCTL